MSREQHLQHNLSEEVIANHPLTNRYEFEAALQALIYSTHDDHVDLVAGILGVFSFGTQYSIASVSLDGINLPKVYLSGRLPSRGYYIWD
jgi:hypothetical protein